MLSMPALATFSQLIEANYSKDPRELFREVSKAFVEHKGNLDTLSYVQYRCGVTTEYSTWVPQ
jgi:hypothetical protein